MKYIENRYTQPNENGVIGLTFEPVKEPMKEVPPEEDTPPEEGKTKKK